MYYGIKVKLAVKVVDPMEMCRSCKTWFQHVKEDMKLCGFNDALDRMCGRRATKLCNI